MTDPLPDPLRMTCPAPLQRHDTIQLAHGGGGRMMRHLIESLLLPQFETSAEGSSAAAPPHDSAVLQLGDQRLAFTTDTFVVSPLFFPGGDIGKLAVYGTANDLAMSGATPRWLSCALVLEEGTPVDTLRRVVESMREAAVEVGVQIVTGDTKVVDRGKGDAIFINTAGVGVIPPGIEVNPARVRPGDRVLVSGDLGRHGIAIMSVREGLEFEGALESDCASLADLVGQLTALGGDLHCLRDLTRGGLAAALIEIAEHANVGIDLDEATIPVAPQVAGACELMGLDPLYVANEGRMIAVVPANAAEAATRLMRSHPAAPQTTAIGTVTSDHAGLVALQNPLGSGRLLDLPSGEQMPRIC
ncbi:MAG: hydrogenase expression/formation protein HypE [Planctomycetes bacterium]|nr:hydrogenase expression/formation protein HypE [Planctomycetota bacterium]